MRRLAQRPTECTVDGISARRSAGASPSSPAAAQRFAAGEGLDGGDPDRSTIDHAVGGRSDSTEMPGIEGTSATPRIYTSLTDVTRAFNEFLK